MVAPIGVKQVGTKLAASSTPAALPSYTTAFLRKALASPKDPLVATFIKAQQNGLPPGGDVKSVLQKALAQSEKVDRGELRRSAVTLSPVGTVLLSADSYAQPVASPLTRKLVNEAIETGNRGGPKQFADEAVNASFLIDLGAMTSKEALTRLSPEAKALFERVAAA